MGKPTEIAAKDPVLDRMGALLDQSQRVVAMLLAREPGAAGSSTTDPLNASGAFGRLGLSLAKNPLPVARAQWHLLRDLTALSMRTGKRFLGRPVEPVIAPPPGDRRFRDRAWQDRGAFDFMKQAYLLTSRFTQEVVKNAPGLAPRDALKVEFYLRQMMDALAPTNFPLTNPEVLRAARDSRGQSLLSGLENLMRDLEDGQGSLRVRVTDERAFSPGKNIAVTPGKVIWRNELMELIHYAPRTPSQFSTPLLFIPPWINKFYILDLRPENSLVRWLLDQGHNVFLISWVNPDASLRAKDFERYMTEGPLTALEVIATVTAQKKVHATGYCLGGTLLACTAAALAARGEDRLESATFLTTLTDFSNVGELSLFVEPEVVDALEQKMNARGYLKGEEMSFPFNLMRSNDLIWSHVINNYFLGKQPFPFDMLYWASDSTRMPAAMHAYYLRKMYIENQLANGTLELGGLTLRLQRATSPAFFLSTREDHIAPWKATYQGTQLWGGPSTFVLTGSGHIAGVINPPTPGKYPHWVAPSLPPDPDAWLAQSTEHAGSWWPRWHAWLTSISSAQVEAAAPGGGKVPALADAPGSFVLVREADLPQAW